MSALARFSIAFSDRMLYIVVDLHSGCGTPCRADSGL